MNDTNILNIEKIQRGEIGNNKKKISNNIFRDFNNTFIILSFSLLKIYILFSKFIFNKRQKKLIYTKSKKKVYLIAIILNLFILIIHNLSH